MPHSHLLTHPQVHSQSSGFKPALISYHRASGELGGGGSWAKEGGGQMDVESWSSRARDTPPKTQPPHVGSPKQQPQHGLKLDLTGSPMLQPQPDASPAQQHAHVDDDEAGRGRALPAAAPVMQPSSAADPPLQPRSAAHWAGPRSSRLGMGMAGSVAGARRLSQQAGAAAGPHAALHSGMGLPLPAAPVLDASTSSPPAASLSAVHILALRMGALEPCSAAAAAGGGRGGGAQRVS